jgi:hypothetical protein
MFFLTDLLNFSLKLLISFARFRVSLLSFYLSLFHSQGKTTCATFNFGGDPQSALAALNYEGIGKIHCVSKNVCHQV